VNSFGRVVSGRPCELVQAGRSGGSFEGARVNSFGRVVRAGRSGGSFGRVV
jgi:hypothetical protein